MCYNGGIRVILYTMDEDITSTPSTERAPNAPDASPPPSDHGAPSPATPQANSSSAEQEVEEFIVICGKTDSGQKFRPSDWCDRLRSTLNALGEEQAEEFAQYVHIVNFENGKCVMISTELQSISPPLYRFFLKFAKDNNLVTKPTDSIQLGTIGNP